MSKIQEYLGKIKIAVYGREVREAIHDSIEECYANVINGKTLADSAALSANAAASTATEKAALAEEKAGIANSAATRADRSADGAITAAENANEKATLADTATLAANDAADNALTAARAASDATKATTSAITEAKVAKEAADSAARDATVAKDAANAAAINANAAITSVNTAVSSANAAASNANTKADQANTAAIYANEKAGIAAASANAADTAGANARAAKEEADKAAKNASDKALLADAARLSADAAATSATTAASNANVAASNANTAADTAELATADCTTATYNANVASVSADKAAKRAEEASILIEQMTVTSENVGPDALSEASMTEINNHYNIHFRLKQGQTGAPFIIKGNAFSTLGELESNIGSPDIGDQYNVGEQPPYDIYRWTGNNWENQGPIGVRINDIPTAEIDAVVNGESVSPTTNKFLGLDGFIHFFSNKLKPLLSGKVNKIEGKGLSTNDFTNDYKDKISSLDNSVTALVNTKVDKLTGKGLSTNDFTSAYKNQVDANKKSIEQLTVSAVVHSVQNLTEAQQAQARSNIGVEYGENVPAALGEPSPGASSAFARSDHVHPLPTAMQVGALTPSDVMDNLTEDDAAKPLSAKQGKKLKMLLDSKTANYTATLTLDGWSDEIPTTQTVAVSGLLDEDTPIIDVDVSELTTEEALTSLTSAWASVLKATASAGNLTVTALVAPETPIPIKLKVVR